MKSFIIFISFILIGQLAFAQHDPISLYKLHKFPCDTGRTTYDVNWCSGVKRDFADSLLTDLYQKILESIDTEINKCKLRQNKEFIKKDTSAETRESILDEEKWIDQLIRLKKSIVISQEEWYKLREMNMNIVSIASEGGTGFVEAENQSIIEDTLERMKKLMSFKQ